MRRLRDYEVDGETFEHAIAMTEAELRSCLSIKTDAAYDAAIERLAAAMILRRAADRPERWVARASTDPRGKGRDRLLMLVDVFDPLRVAQLHKGLLWDEKHKGDPRAPQRGRFIVLD